MSSSSGAEPSASGLWSRLARPAQVIIVSSVMFTFITYWRTAAIVLCDLASTAYYIGGIVEQAIGSAAPWFILAVLLFSYAVRSVYIESCALFVRGGVYRVVKEALGGFLAKVSVSVLLFDYILTGPVSGVSAGQYLVGLLLDFVKITNPQWYTWAGLETVDTRHTVQRWGAVLVAIGVTLYFFRQNLIGIQESSRKALRIMIATTIMATLLMIWCAITLLWQGPAPGTSVWHAPDLRPKPEVVSSDGSPRNEAARIDETGRQHDPLGAISWLWPGLAGKLREPGSWLSIFAVLGLFVAFGHSLLAMSGKETLAQVYREVESPKLQNFKKAALVVFLYSLLFTGGVSFLAVLLIPDDVRMRDYSGNIISGIAMNVWGTPAMRLGLSAFVVIVGFLILSGAVNTAIIGSNGVLNRVAEDGVLPEWFLRPHPKYGTTYRILYTIVGLQLAAIVFSRGHVYVLGEAYAFGVVWSFVFKTLAMLVLRFKDRTPRPYRVPLNVTVRGREVPLGLLLIFSVLLFSAVLNLLTKEVATLAGMLFLLAFLALFTYTERSREKKLSRDNHKHLEQFNREEVFEVTPEALGLTKMYRKLVAIRSSQNLVMLEKALAETDPRTTALVVMTARLAAAGDSPTSAAQVLDAYEQKLMTAVVEKAEEIGKEVKPLIVPTNNPLHAMLQTAAKLQAHELVIGASNKYTADEQLEHVAFYWISLHGGQPVPLTVRILGTDRDMAFDLGGGNRIPNLNERQARSVAELRAAGIGVHRVLMVHDGTSESSDLFQEMLTMIDPAVELALVPVAPLAEQPETSLNLLPQDQARARQLHRTVTVLKVDGDTGEAIIRLARAGRYEVIVLAVPAEPAQGGKERIDTRAAYIMNHAHCRVVLAVAPRIPQEILDSSHRAN
jgi:amino acid transporter